MMKILAIATAYHPDTELMKKSISSYIGGVGRLLIWRNSPIDEKEFEALAGGGKIEFCGDCSNAGISVALNYAWHYAESNGYTHILTMDQDSIWEGFEVYLTKIKADTETRRFYAPGINDQAFEGDFRYADTMITSGMMVPTVLAEEAGGWREDFKVDGIDNDFYFRAMALGWHPTMVGGCSIRQSFGRLEYHRFLWGKIGVLNYSPERIYGIYRNNYIVIKSYPGTENMARRFHKTCYWSRPLRILLAEKDKFAKFKAMFQGIRDARRWLRNNNGKKSS